VALHRQGLSLRTRPVGELRLADAQRDGVDLALPVQLGLPMPVRGALRFPGCAFALGLLIGALLLWGGGLATGEIVRAGDIWRGEAALDQGELLAAREAFTAASVRRDTSALQAQLQAIAYQLGRAALERKEWLTAQRELAAAGSVEDAPALLLESFYRPAVAAIEAERWEAAAISIAGLEGYAMGYRDIDARIAATPELAEPLARARWSSGRVGTIKTIADDAPAFLSATPSVVLMEQGGRLLLVELRNTVEQSVDLQDDWIVNRSTLAISADAAQLAYMSSNTGLLTVVDSRGRLIAELPDTVEAQQIAFSPDGRTLAVEMPTSVLFWSLPESQVRAEVPAWTDLDGPAFSFSPDGKLALLTRGNDLLLVRTEDGSVLQTLRAGALNAFAFSPDGASIVAALNSSTIAFWRVADGGLERELYFESNSHHLGRITDLVLSPDGLSVGLASTDGVLLVQVMDAQSSRLFPDALALAFSPDSQLLAVGSSKEFGQEEWLELFSLRHGFVLQRLPLTLPTDESYGNSWFITLAFSADGTTLLSQTNHSGTRLWQPLPWAELDS
jgi:hypothetical protein